MALTVNASSPPADNVSAKVSGDIGDIQIAEVSDTESDSEQDKNVSKTVSVSNLPNNLIQKSEVPVFGSVAITNSDNVQFGNNTFFNGPVTIKQVITKSGVDNPAYYKSDDEGSPPSKPTGNLVKKKQLLLWHKVTCLLVCISILGGILAIVLVLQNNHEDDIKILNSPDFTPNVTGSLSKVVGICYNNIPVTIISIILFTLTFLLISSFLLTNYATDNGMVYEKNKMHEKCVTKVCTLAEADPLIIAPDVLRIVSRTDWLAQPVENALDKLQLPVPWVIIAHTATESCYTQSQCVLRVRLIQSFHIESRGWDDIGYNFLVGGDGSVYYGRGWDYQGAHTKYYNRYSIGIAFIGTFNNDQPPKQQIEACRKIIKQGVQLGKIAEDYKLLAHRQLMSTLSPGDKVVNVIKEWPHYVKNDADIKDLLPSQQLKG